MTNKPRRPFWTPLKTDALLLFGFSAWLFCYAAFDLRDILLLLDVNVIEIELAGVRIAWRA